jgi:hypothetical protein
MVSPPHRMANTVQRANCYCLLCTYIAIHKAELMMQGTVHMLDFTGIGNQAYSTLIKSINA